MNLRSIVLLLCLLILIGCDQDWPKSSKTCEVSGQLTLDGEAISGVKVVFVPQQVNDDGELTKIASATTNDRGGFELKIDSRDERKILHGRYRVLVSKMVDGKELFHKSYNVESVLMVEVDTPEAIQRPKLELKSTGTL